MENIKFIKQIAGYIDREGIIAGNCIYYKLKNNNRVKTWCETNGVCVEIINCKEGKLDQVFFPFRNYFEAVKCYDETEKWYQYIVEDCWAFEKLYSHVLPKENDYINLSIAIENYIEMFE